MGMSSTIDKLREGRLQGFKHVYRRQSMDPVRRVEPMNVEGMGERTSKNEMRR